MKILLIYPVPPRDVWPVGLFRSRWAPSGIAQIAAELRHAGHDVRIHVREEQLVKNGFDWDRAEVALRDLLTEFRPEMVGVSVVTPSMPEAARIAELVKELLGVEVTVVAGGPHPSAMPAGTLDECPHVDIVAIGEAEATMLELVERGPAPDLAGIAYRDGGNVVTTPRRPPEKDLDRFQAIPYDLFDMDYYTAPNPWMMRWRKLSAMNLRTSRGCPNRCRFCGGHVVAGLGVRFHSVERVLDNMHRAAEEFGVQAVLFEDETLGADRDRLLTLCEGICRAGLHRKLEWDCCLRVDQAEPELLAAMAAAGCSQIEYGFESGSDAALKRVGKNASGKQNRQAVERTRQVGIRIFADIMIGMPGETAADLAATGKFLRWAKPEVLSVARFCPLPGTPIFDELAEDVRARITWPGFAYLDRPGFSINLTATPDEQFETLTRRFMKYFYRPALDRHRMRDAATLDPSEYRRLRKRARRFALRHPIRAARLPV